jgi:hypothetical protein
MPFAAKHATFFLRQKVFACADGNSFDGQP